MTKIDWHSEEIWKPRLDALKEKALKDWTPVTAREKPVSFQPVLVHDWKVFLSASGSDVKDVDLWIFSARWPAGGDPPVDELAWIKQAITHLGAPAGTEEADMGGKTLARYWIWKAPRRAG